MQIHLIQADITKVEVDAIVNAANSSLLGGGGVDGAIHRAGGAKILEDCRAIRAKQGKCKTGEAVITSAGNLPAQYVIHTVGPVWNGGKTREKELLASCYKRSLEIADDNGVTSIAFSNVSTGIYRFPKHLAAKIAIETVRSFASTSVTDVTFVCFDEENHDLYKSLLEAKDQDGGSEVEAI